MTDPSHPAPLPSPAAPSPIPPQGPPPRRGIGVAGALILGCGGLFAVGFVLLVVLAVAGGGSPSVSSDTVLKMNLGGLVPEHVHAHRPRRAVRRAGGHRAPARDAT